MVLGWTGHSCGGALLLGASLPQRNARRAGSGQGPDPSPCPARPPCWPTGLPPRGGACAGLEPDTIIQPVDEMSQGPTRVTRATASAAGARATLVEMFCGACRMRLGTIVVRGCGVGVYGVTALGGYAGMRRMRPTQKAGAKFVVTEPIRPPLPGAVFTKRIGGWAVRCPCGAAPCVREDRILRDLAAGIEAVVLR